MSNKLIITAALLGGGTRKEMNPAVPYTAEEIAKDAVACAKAGAAIIHIHVRNKEGNQVNDVALFRDAWEMTQDALYKEGLDAILNLSTGGFYTPDEVRIAPVREIRPEMCSYNPGSINWGNWVYLNSPDYMRDLGLLAQETNTKVEIEIFDTAMFNGVRECVRKGYLKDPCHFQFIMDIPGGMQCSIKNVAFLKDLLPEGATWSITGCGKTHMQAMLIGLAAGADGLRTGLEDAIWLQKGVPATNESFVKQAVDLAHMAGREIATAEEARRILSMK